MGDTIWLSDLLPWAAGALALFLFMAWIFFGETEVEDGWTLALRLALALAFGALLWALALFGLLPAGTRGVIFGLYPAGWLGALVGTAIGAIRHR